MRDKSQIISEINSLETKRDEDSESLRELIDIIHFTEQVTMRIYGQLDEPTIYKNVIEEFAKSGQYSASIVLLTDKDSKLRIAASSLPNTLMKKGEKLTGLRVKKYTISLNKSNIYRKVITEGKTLHTSVSDVISELLPRPLASLITKTMGYENRASIITPLIKNKKIIGAFAMTSTKLAEYLIPSVKNLARHISVALELAEENTKRRNVEEKLVGTTKFLQNIIDSASEFIISFDKSNKITSWNKTAEHITGYKAQKVTGRPLTMLSVFDKPQELSNALTHIYDGTTEAADDLVLKTKHGKRVIKPSYSIIQSGNGESIGTLLFGRDITYERESHKKLIRGNSYLIMDKNNNATVDLFKDLTKLEYKGLIITRTNPEMIKSQISSRDIQIALLNQEQVEGFEQISTLDELITKIKNFSSRHTDTVVLLDRIDYLITFFSFEQFVKSLYQITSIMSENKSILLLHLHPSLLDSRQKTIIEQELQMLPSQNIDNIQIEDTSYDILRFIQEQNQRNTLVSFKKISKEFSIDKSTTAKRIKILENNKLVSVKKQGRTKTVHMSEKGNVLLHKRQIV